MTTNLATTLKSLIDTKSLILVEKKPGPKDSNIWKVFKKVCSKANEYSGVLRCETCKNLYKYQSGTGNSSLNKHYMKCHGQTTMEAFAPSNKKILPSDMESIKQAQKDFTVQTLSSFKINKNPAFKKMCEVMINIGAKYGNADPEKILFSTETIRKDIYAEAKLFKPQLIKKLSDAKIISSGHFSLMSDIWTEPSNNGSYLQVHIQFINNFELKNTVLDMKHFPQRHTGANIKNSLNLLLEELGVDPADANITTDCGSNMLSAVSEMQSYPCCCHRLSTVIEGGWKNTLAIEPELLEMYQSINKLITTVNHKSDIQCKLVVKMQDSNQTRAWRGLLKKLQQVLTNYEALEELSRTDRKLLPILTIDKTLLGNVVNFLTPIMAKFDVFEQESVPTINLIVPTYYELLDHLSKSRECPIISSLAFNLETELERKFKPILMPIHFAATLLTPQYRKFNFISGPEKAEKLKIARSYIAENIDEQPVAKKPKQVKKKYGEDSDDDDDDFNENLGELDRYLKFKVPRDEKTENPLEFYRNNGLKFPALTNLALKILAVGAASSLSEKCFSIAGKINKPDRAHFNPDNLPLLVILSYKKKFA